MTWFYPVSSKIIPLKLCHYYSNMTICIKDLVQDNDITVVMTKLQ
jgi:hypothetical protein